MAKGGGIIRWVRALFDVASAKKTEAQLESSLQSAGKKGGAGFVRELRAAFEKKTADLKVALAKNLISPKEFRVQANAAAKEFNTGLIAGMEKARSAGKLTDTEYLKLSRTLKRVGDDGAGAGSKIGGSFLRAGAALAGFFSLSKAVAFFRQSITAAIESEQSVARLEVALESLGLRYRQVAPEVEKYLDNLQKTTRFSDEDGREALSRLITITGDYRTALSLLDLTANIAEKRQTTMAEAAQTAGDASRGLTKGMKDLGIASGETGSIVEKIQKNIGNLATETSATSRTLAITNNLWGEFQEKIGLAILGSEGLKGSSRGLTQALIDLNEWADKNSGAISKFIDKLVAAASAIAKVGEFIVMHTPNIYTLGKAWDWVRGKTEEATVAAVTGEEKGTDAAAKGTARRRELTKEEMAAREDRQRELAAEIVRVETDIAVKRLQIEQGLTEALAREQVRRDALLKGKPKRGSGTEAELAEAYKLLDEANILLAAGFDEKLSPALSRTISQFLELKGVTQTFAGAQRKMASDFGTPWVRTLKLISAQFEENSNLWAELGQGLAEGGLAGLAKLAAGKVKQNIAEAVENAARALSALAFGRPDAATGFGLAAAQHTAAAAAWGLVGGASGGGGAGAGGGSGGGLDPMSGEPRGPNFGGLESIQSSGPEVHIYLAGEGFHAMNPRVQKVVHGAMEQAKEVYGNNAKIHLHGGH